MFRKFIAASTRDCLRMMRDALGADAMIVSTRRTAAGVEVVGISAEDMPSTEHVPAEGAESIAQAPARPAAAPAQPERRPELWDDMDDEPVRLSPAARVLASHEEPPAPAAPLPADSAGRLPLAQWPQVPERQISHLVRNSSEFDPAHALAKAAAEDEDAKPVMRIGLIPPEGERRRQRQAAAQPKAPPAMPAAPVLAHISAEDRDLLASQVTDPIMGEMRSMRSWLAHQMDALTWQGSTQGHPGRRELWRRMVDCGFTPELARTVAARLPAGQEGEQIERWLADVLVRNLACVEAQDSVVEKGGRYAIVGPTGVGKTTTTAKLATRCVVKYGAGSLGLISTDQNRIGAVDQLRTFGQILGVEVYAARGASDLEVLLSSMSDRRLILIDTAGMGQRDEHLTQHLQAISAEGVERLLVLPAGSHAEQAEDVVRAYAANGLAGMIVSKLDEAVRLGGVLDAVIRHRLPLHYMTNGQRVPEDLHAANARLLVHRALRVRNAPVFALEGDELDWACAAPSAAGG